MMPPQPPSPVINQIYRVRQDLNLYEMPESHGLVTQAGSERYLKPLEVQNQAVRVRLCEDDYQGWVRLVDWIHLEQVSTSYQPLHLSKMEIEVRLPGAIAFAQSALSRPNHYLWGGTVGPNFDCSGLMQSAFQSVGIWIPRDAYQQEAFADAIPCSSDDHSRLQPGDLVFFGPPAKATHVGLYLGEGRYLHSSGQDLGRNGIGIDWLDWGHNPISDRYLNLLRGAGRIRCCYVPSEA
jgi:cell wall-associated NlpC family hydrolase